MLHAQATYCGMVLDCFDINGEIYLTAASIANGLSKDARRANDWLRRGNKSKQGIDVLIGIGNGAKKKAKAYPISLMEEMIEYWAKRGDKHAQSLINAAWRTDFESSARHALGYLVTEQTREVMRRELFEKFIGMSKDNMRHTTDTAKDVYTSHYFRTVKWQKFHEARKAFDAELKAKGYVKDFIDGFFVNFPNQQVCNDAQSKGIDWFRVMVELSQLTDGRNLNELVYGFDIQTTRSLCQKLIEIQEYSEDTDYKHLNNYLEANKSDIQQIDSSDALTASKVLLGYKELETSKVYGVRVEHPEIVKIREKCDALGDDGSLFEEFCNLLCDQHPEYFEYTYRGLSHKEYNDGCQKVREQLSKLIPDMSEQRLDTLLQEYRVTE